MNIVENKTGLVFGKLTVLSFSHQNRKNVFYLFQCDCGDKKVIEFREVKRGNTKSCGCLLKSMKKHGESNTRLYGIWQGARSRCNNQNSKSYKYCGLRGIVFCEEWKEFLTFKNWALNNGYKETLTLDRINNNEGYCPSNCRWATYTEQANNKTNNVFIEYKGERLNCTGWSLRLGNNPRLVQGRLFSGWDSIKAITTPQRIKQTPLFIAHPLTFLICR